MDNFFELKNPRAFDENHFIVKLAEWKLFEECGRAVKKFSLTIQGKCVRFLFWSNADEAVDVILADERKNIVNERGILQP